MGFLRRNDNAKPDYTALQLQTSTSTLPIPIVWGQNKIAPNLLWYAKFQAVPGGSGKGIGGKGGLFGGGARGAADYTYTADLIMALCEGPITPWGAFERHRHHLERPRRSTSRSSSASAPSAARRRKTVWPYLAAIYPYNALAYQGTAYSWGARLQSRRLGLDRQPQCRDLRSVRRNRRQRHRRRSGAGHPRLS